MNYKRVHGDVHITRSNKTVDHYKKAKEFLKQDFYNMCGYCGKKFDITHTKSQIDHFVPKKKYQSLEHEYSNLVLCCPTCNNKKHEDWPSNDISLPITTDGKRGYVDPATIEYDNHVARVDDGTIVGLTEVGKYMVQRLDFENRPMKECFRAQELSILIKKITDKGIFNAKLAKLYSELDYIRNQLFIANE